MKMASNKIISSIMLCIALLPLIFAGYVQVSEAVIHRQMKEELEKKNLVTIHIRSSQIIWTENDKEAIVNGNMFDVKKYSIINDEIELTGLFDKDEDALFNQIDNAQKQNNNNATGSILVLKWFGCFSWNANQIITEIIPAKRILSESLQQNNFIQNPVLSIGTPPPRFS